MNDKQKIAELIRRGEALKDEMYRVCQEHNDRSCDFDVNESVREWFWLVQDINRESLGL